MDWSLMWARMRRSLSSSFRHQQAGRWLKAYRPRLEGLEVRCLPSTVTNLDDSGPGSLRDAITNTPAGGTVDFDPGLAGTITLTSGSLSIDHDLTINGPGADQLTVSGNNLFRVLNVFAGSQVTISDLTVANGFAEHGSGLFNDGNLNLTRVVVSHNSLDNAQDLKGGAILSTGDLTLVDSTLSQNGYPFPGPGGYGGGIYNSGSLTGIRTTITGNNAGTNVGFGGGIYNLGSIRLMDSIISQNHAVQEGGGIDSVSGSLYLSDTAVTGNGVEAYHYGQGGGIRNAGVMDVTDSAISGNAGGGPGGAYGIGIYNTGVLNLTRAAVDGNSEYGVSDGGGIYNTGTATLADCSISGNHNGDFGGGIYTDGTMTLTDCTVANNSVSEEGNIYQHGGGIAGVVTAIRTAIYGNGSAAYGGGVSGGGTFIDCTITNNSAFHAGGGIYGGGTFINSTITDNSAGAYVTDGGGGIAVTDTVVLRNTIVARNHSFFAAPDVLGLISEATYNLIGDGSGSSGVVDGVDGNQVGTGGLVLDPGLGQLQDNGGPTWTEALLPTSPAIDAGNNADAPDTDQRGFHRIVGGTADVGAYEYQPPATLTLLQSDHNPSSVGQAVTFTAQVTGSTPDSNVPTGLVTFFDNGNVLGTVPLQDGAATLTTSALTAGSHTILAVYTGFSQGDFRFDASLSEPLNQQVLSATGSFSLRPTVQPAIPDVNRPVARGNGAGSPTDTPAPQEELLSPHQQARDFTTGFHRDIQEADLFCTEFAAELIL